MYAGSRGYGAEHYHQRQFEYVSLFQQGEDTTEARKQILIEQRELLLERMEEMRQTLERLNSKIDRYEQTVDVAEQKLRRE